jgi:WD40 repeat protein
LCGLTICNTVSALAFNHAGTVLAAGDASGYAEPWSVPGDAGVTFDVPRAAVGKPIWGLSVTSSDLLAIADGTGDSYLYQVSGTTQGPMRGQLADPSPGTQGVGTLGFSPDGKYLVTGDTNGDACLWHLG